MSSSGNSMAGSGVAAVLAQPDEHERPDVRVVSGRIYRGSNIYYRKTVARLRVALTNLDGLERACRSEDFAARLQAQFGTLPFLPVDPYSGAATPPTPPDVSDPDFIRKSLLWAILAVDRAARAVAHRLDPIEEAHAVRVGEHRVFFVWESPFPSLSLDCAEAAVAGFSELVASVVSPSKPASAFRKLYAAAMASALGNRLSPTVAILRATAQRRGIPCSFEGDSYLRLGQGRHQKLICASITNDTTINATELTSSKELTSLRLVEHRLPVPKQIGADNRREALQAAMSIGYPVVIKPVIGSQGDGITAGVANASQLVTAYKLARRFASRVVVEKFLPGTDYRLLVINNKFVAALTRRPPVVKGDGRHTIDELIDILNQDPFRNGFDLKQIQRDDDLLTNLTTQGLALSSILPVGACVALRTVANVSQGGVAIDVTDQTHADIRDMAERSARAVGLDVAGIDYMTTDITRSYRDTGGGIVEVNARPGFCMHTRPRHGTARDVPGKMLEIMFPDNRTARVPCAVLIGDGEAAEYSHALYGLVRLQTNAAGLVAGKNSFFNGLPSELVPENVSRAPVLMLLDPQLAVLVTTADASRVVEYGLRLNSTDVVGLIEPTGEFDSEDHELAIGALLRSSPTWVVFRDGYDLAKAATANVARSRILLVCRDAISPEARKNVNMGGAAVALERHGGRPAVTLYHGPAAQESGTVIGYADETCCFYWSARASQITNGSPNIEVRVFAVAMAWALLGKAFPNASTSVVRVSKSDHGFADQSNLKDSVSWH